jgi:hypothetical protein
MQIRFFNLQEGYKTMRLTDSQIESVRVGVVSRISLLEYSLLPNLLDTIDGLKEELAVTRAAVLEEAAKECEKPYNIGEFDLDSDDCAEYVCARRIRALATSTERDALAEHDKRVALVLRNANEICRSAYQIAARSGAQTNWDAFIGRLETELKAQSELLAALAKETVKP